MPDPEEPSAQVPPSIQQDGQTYSPSPTPGEPRPQRRTEDTATYALEWSVLAGGLSTWLGAVIIDIGKFEAPTQLMEWKFLTIHGLQLLGVILSVVAAKRMK